MYTVSTSILASCLMLLLYCLFGFVDASILDALIFWDLIFVPFLAAAAIGLVIGFAIAKLIGQIIPRIAEVTESVQLSFQRDDALNDSFYCMAADTTNGKNAFHLYAVNDNNLKLVKSLWENNTTLLVEDDNLKDWGIWKKTQMIADPSSRLYHWALTQPKALRNELHLPPNMILHN